MGDLNINWLNCDNDTKKLKQIVHAEGFTQIITKPTRITNMSSTLIDHVITNDFNVIEVPRNFPMISDHEIVGVELLVEATVQKNSFVYHRNLTNEVVSDIIAELIGKNWNYTCVDVNRLYVEFIQNIQESIDKYAPIKKIMPNKYPWITREINTAQRERDEGYRRFGLTKEAADWEEYKVKRNKVVSMIRNEKTKFYNQKIDQCKGDGKKMWRTLKDLTGNKKQHTDFSNIDFGNYNETTEDNFNKFYSDSINEIAQTIENRNWTFQPERERKEPLLVNFTPLTLSGLKKIVYGLKNKSTCDDLLNIKLVKQLFCVIGYPLLYLINTSLTTGKIPSELKTSVIVPVPKVLKPKTPVDFRPINLLPVVDKIIETSVCDQLKNFFETNNLLYVGQSGFRGNHSCESALQYVCAKWRRDMNEGNVILSVFVDLKRAFETIDREILVKKLMYYGVGASALNWIKDYLTDRCHRTKVDKKNIRETRERMGCPTRKCVGSSVVHYLC